MKTHTLGATAPLNGYIKPTTTFVQLELESALLATSQVPDVEISNNNQNSDALDFLNENAFDTPKSSDTTGGDNLF